MKRNTVYGVLVCAAVLCSCSAENGGGKQVTESVTYSITTETTAAREEETTKNDGFLGDYTVQTEPEVSDEEKLSLFFETERPDIIINELSTEEEILLAGKTAAEFYTAEAYKYFSFSSYSIFRQGDWINITDENGDHNYLELTGLYTDPENKNAFTVVPVSYSEVKELITENLALTEEGFRELCNNSPTGYYEVDGKFCARPGDGGSAGHSYNYIDSCEKDGDTVTFNCVGVGLASEWGYEQDMTWDYTFRLKQEDGEWKLDGVSDGMLFMMGAVGTYEDKLLCDELLNDLMPVYDSVIRINELGIIAYDEKDVKTVDGTDYYRVTDERFLTWKSWTDYVKSVYSDEAAEEALKNGRTIEQDGLFYINGKINGGPSGGYYIENTERTADGGASTTATITDFTRRMTLKCELSLDRTENGLRIAEEAIEES